MLGSDPRFAQLRAWARSELAGYDADSELPDYRRPTVALLVDCENGAWARTGQQISPESLPDVVRGKVTDAVPLAFRIGELEEMLRSARDTGQPVRLSVPHAQQVGQLMATESGDPYLAITRVYWSVGAATLAGVLDHVRTTLAELLAAVSVHEESLSLRAANGGAQGDATTGRDRWPLWVRWATVISALAGVAGAIAAVSQWQGWGT